MGEHKDAPQTELNKSIIQGIINNAVPRATFNEKMRTSAAEKNSGKVDWTEIERASYAVESESLFRSILVAIQEEFPVIPLKWVDESVAHETEHLAEAHRLYARFGDKVIYQYAVTCLLEPNGNINFIPRYIVRFMGVVPENSETEQVSMAPKRKSVGDLSQMGGNIEGKDDSQYY